MKYLILIYDNPASRKLWESFPAAQRAEGLALYTALREDLAASGELIVSEALADPDLTTPSEGIAFEKCAPTDCRGMPSRSSRELSRFAS